MSNYRKVIIETFRHSGGGSRQSVRARPVSGQGLDINMNVECSLSMRKNNPVGTLFLLEAKVTDKEGGTPFLYAYHNAPYKIISVQKAKEFLSKNNKNESARSKEKSSLTRKQFIESQGATCRNWTWSWSFINEKEKVIIFGAWDVRTEGNTSLILSKSWAHSSTGRRQPGYKQAREHIHLIEEKGYQLQTFPMTFSDQNRDKDGVGPATIRGFIPKLSNKTLHKVGEDWYASDDVMSETIAEEIVKPETFYEGASKTISVNTYERNSDARKKCIEHYGYVCAVCSFDFEKRYGSIGENYIHVHHRVPISEIKKEYQLDPINDLIPVCPNCHSMIHKTTPALTVDQLKAHLTTIKRDVSS